MVFAILFALCWLPIRIMFPTKVIGKKNLPKKEGYVLTCNHYSNMDPILLNICLFKKIRFLAKKELFESKFLAFFLKRFGAYPINREKPEISSVKFALNALKDKKILGIFPEGTRNKDLSDDSLQDLKNGAVIFAAKGNAKMVPVIIYKRCKFLRKNYIVIGEPIEIEGEDKRRLTPEETEKNTLKLVSAMNQLRSDMDEKFKNKKEKKNGKKQ